MVLQFVSLYFSFSLVQTSSLVEFGILFAVTADERFAFLAVTVLTWLFQT